MAETANRPRLAALLMADLAGFSALAERDEAQAVALVQALHRDVIAPAAAQHNGRVVKTMGDGFLLEFSSAMEAAEAALNIRTAAGGLSAKAPARLPLRIGLHAGEVVASDGDLFGNCVNIAARIEALAEPGTICLSEDFARQLRGGLAGRLQPLGPHRLRNISEPVQLFRLGEAPGPAPAAEDLDLSVAVLPFTCAPGGTEGTEYLADGITEDIISGLSRFRELKVIAPGSCFFYKNKRIPAAEAAAALGVRYLAEGSLRQAGNRLRLTVGLTEGQSGRSLWSERYERDMPDLFVLQDEIVLTLVQTLAGRLLVCGQERAAARAASGRALTAHGLVLQARNLIVESRDALAGWRRLYEQAITADPGCAAAYAGLGYTYSFEWTSGWSDDPEILEKALDLLRRAARLDDMDHEAQRRLGVLHLFQGEHALAKSHLDRALQLNPNDAHAMAYLGLYHVYLGDPETALEELDRATRHNPFHPTFYYWFTGLAHYCARDYQAAIDALSRAAELFPEFVAPHRHMAACYARLGRPDAAAEQRRIVLQLQPDFTIRKIAPTLPYRNPSEKEHYLGGLRLAGFPEDAE